MRRAFSRSPRLDERIAALDPELFDQIPAQLEGEDRRSLLALHAACRLRYRSFVYLEIGSHLGGSLQTLVRDPACTAIISIDARPDAQPDERGPVYQYPENSTARMLSLLAEIPGADLSKLQTIDASTDELDSGALPQRPHLCFVDGEHTDAAALRDARFCLKALQQRGVIVFHDAQIVYRGIHCFIRELEDVQIPFAAYLLPMSVFVIELGAARLRDTEPISQRLKESYIGYLYGLESTTEYRDFYVSRSGGE